MSDGIIWVEPTDIDAETYWRDVDDDPSAVVLVDVADEEGWYSAVFSTRRNAIDYIHGHGIDSAVVSVRVIDAPDYGCGWDA